MENFATPICFADLENSFDTLMSGENFVMRVHPAHDNRLNREILSILIFEGNNPVGYCFFTDNLEAFVVESTKSTAPFPLDITKRDKDDLNIPLYPNFWKWSDSFKCQHLQMPFSVLEAIITSKKKIFVSDAPIASAIAS